jgi:hypothetical protein
MFELASTYVASGKQDLGLKTYDRLINRYQRILHAKAVLRQGLIYNSDRNVEALTKFKSSSRFP